MSARKRHPKPVQISIFDYLSSIGEPYQPGELMNVYVRVYAALAWTDPAERYLSRAIIREVSKDGKAREGFSVCFHGATADMAEAKAREWIEAERDKAAAKDATIRALIERQRKA